MELKNFSTNVLLQFNPALKGSEKVEIREIRRSFRYIHSLARSCATPKEAHNNLVHGLSIYFKLNVRVNNRCYSERAVTHLLTDILEGKG